MESRQNAPLTDRESIIVTAGTKLEEIERLAILATLRFKDNNRTHTAKTLGIGIRTLQRKLRQYGVEAMSQAV
jgi:DNA-binding NtrC family response regulator